MVESVRKYRLHLGLVVLVLLAFWPITSGLYLPKWDNVDCYLPYRYFVHFSYENGQLPLWNPFQHLGYPAYSDLQNGLYNPIVWLIHLIGNYDTLSVSIELSFYWLIGAFGAFKFMRLFTDNPYSQFFGALAFGLSGFMVGTAQIMIFIAGAAFLPHVLYHLIRFFKENLWRDVFWLSLFIGLHVSAASPAYSIVLFYLIFLIFAWALWMKYRSNIVKWTWARLIVLIFITVLCLLPIISSTVEFLPYFGRARKLEYGSFLLQNPFDWHGYISFLFPLSTLSSSDWFGSTDLTMRNGYIGFLPLLFALLTLFRIREVKIRSLWIVFIVFLLMAAGGETPFYRLVYHLPGFGLFRHPSIFRAHALLLLTTLAVIGFDHVVVKKQTLIIDFKRMILFCGIGFIACFFLLFWYRFPGEIGTWVNEFSYSKELSFFSMRTGLLINSLLLVILCVALYSSLVLKKEISAKWIILFTSIDLLIHAVISGPYTLCYPYKQSEYRSYFMDLPKDINQNDAQQPYSLLKENYDPKIPGIWRNTATLHKRLTFEGHNQTQFASFNALEKEGRFDWLLVNPLFTEAKGFNPKTLSDKQLAKSIELKACLWQWDGPMKALNSDTMMVKNPKIGFNSFEVTIANTSDREDILLLTQNYHQNWKARLNGKELKIHQANEAIMGIRIPKKTSGRVTVLFESPWFLPSTIAAASAYLFLFTLLIFSYLKKYFNN